MAKFLSVQKRAQEIREAYEASGQSDYANILLYGDFGTGKTHAISTAPCPIWVHSFDPGGSKVSPLQSLIKSGDCFVDTRFEDATGSDWQEPYVWDAWEDEFDAMRESKDFDHIGTFCIDSFTKMSDALMNAIMKKSGHKGQTPSLPDYQKQQFAGVELMGRLASLPCHVIITGHLQREKNEINGKIETSMLLYGKMAEKIPLCLDEKYITISEAKGTGVEYKLQTQNDKEYKASTRMGGGKFQKYMEPNLKRMLKLAGFSHEDKPRLDTLEEAA